MNTGHSLEIPSEIWIPTMSNPSVNQRDQLITNVQGLLTFLIIVNTILSLHPILRFLSPTGTPEGHYVFDLSVLCGWYEYAF